MNKKHIVLFLLFIAPILAYVFFASGINYFVELPVLTEEVEDLDGFYDIEGNPVTLEGKITILMFLGENPMDYQVSVYNLVHKTYNKNHRFHDFQMVTILPEAAKTKIDPLIQEISGAVEDLSDWHFVYGSADNIESVYRSLQAPYPLHGDWYSEYVFIVDKDLKLRGRDDDEDDGILFGYNAEQYSEINNKLGDDLKILLAEYRLALKKHNRNDYLVQ